MRARNRPNREVRTSAGGCPRRRLATPRPPPASPPAPAPLPTPASPTLSELFAASPRDGGATGFLLAQLARGKPLLWVQERMAMLEAGRIYPPGLGIAELIHVEARDARAALVGDGGRAAMLGAGRGDRRDLGRPQGARFHRHAAAGGRRRAQRRGGVAGPARRPRQSERGADALARGQRAEPGPPARPQGAGGGAVGRRTVSRARCRAGKMDYRS